MKIITKTRLFPWTTLLVGLIGFALRCWLYSEQEGNLLPAHHPAGTICFILLAIMMAAIWLGVQNVSARAEYGEVFPKSVTSFLSCVPSTFT